MSPASVRCPLDVDMRALYVPPALRAPIIQAKHGMRADTAAEIGVIVPGSQVVPAAKPRTRPVRNFIVVIAGRIEAYRRRPILLELVICLWHVNETRPDLLAQPRSRLDRELVGGQMLHALGEHRLEGLEPGGEVDARDPEE